jgi:hypothetical protein
MVTRIRKLTNTGLVILQVLGIYKASRLNLNRGISSRNRDQVLPEVKIKTQPLNSNSGVTDVNTDFSVEE